MLRKEILIYLLTKLKKRDNIATYIDILNADINYFKQEAKNHESYTR